MVIIFLIAISIEFWKLLNSGKFSILYSLGIPNPPVEALMATCALALLHKDNESAQFAANELSKYESDSEYGHHAIYLITQFYLSIVNISS